MLLDVLSDRSSNNDLEVTEIKSWDVWTIQRKHAPCIVKSNIS